jgi:glycopeptide antibiotics resistance protein
LFVINIVGNIVVFVPLGVLLPRIHGRFRSWQSTLVAALGVSALIEVLQSVGAQRVTDVDDLLLNALGALLGYGCYALLCQ